MTIATRQRDEILASYRANTMTFAAAVKALVSTGMSAEAATWLIGQAMKGPRT